MKILEITLSGFQVKSSIPNNFKVLSINYISNTIGLGSETIENIAIMDSEGASIVVAKEEDSPILPVINQSTS